jgi:hypothetical protein
MLSGAAQKRKLFVAPSQSQTTSIATLNLATAGKPHKLLMPNGHFRGCTYVNGNCVLIQKQFFKKMVILILFYHPCGE